MKEANRSREMTLHMKMPELGNEEFLSSPRGQRCRSFQGLIANNPSGSVMEIIEGHERDDNTTGRPTVLTNLDHWELTRAYTCLSPLVHMKQKTTLGHRFRSQGSGKSGRNSIRRTWIGSI